MGINVIDYSAFTVEATAKTLVAGASPTMPDSAKGAVITLEQSNVRFRTDGTVPTTSEGHIMYVGDVLTMNSWSVPKLNWRQPMTNLSFIAAVAATTGIFKVTWYD